MKSSLGSILLIAGTIVASLAAASGEKPWTAVPLDEAQRGDSTVLLFQDVFASEADADAGAVPVGEAGSPVTDQVVGALRSQGLNSIRIRKLAQEAEELTVDGVDSIEGRVLAGTLHYDDASGARVDRDEAQERLEREELLREFVEAAGDEALPATWTLANTADDVRPFVLDDPQMEGALILGTDADYAALRSSALLGGIPPMRILAPEGRFIDVDLAQKIVELGYPGVSARVPKPAWDWRAWSSGWIFLVGLFVMLSGVVLMRSARTEAAVAAAEASSQSDQLSPREALDQIVERTGALAANSESMSRNDLLAACDDLLTVQVFVFGEAKDQLRAELGGRDFAKVMAAFSTGERRLSRAWSAAADGYREEAVASLDECVGPFEAALEALGRRPGVERTEEGAEYVVWEPGGREG